VDPKVKEFLVFSSLLLGVLVLYMLYRPKRPVSRLKLRDSGTKLNHQNDTAFFKAHQREPMFEDGATPSGSRELNVIFQFNGHSFEAYEVLGLPAGSPLDVVEKAYAALMQNPPEGAGELISLAYKAIRRKIT
jgi:hypothetical protein